MTLMWMFYWIDVLSSISTYLMTLSIIGIFISSICSVICIVSGADATDDDYTRTWRESLVKFCKISFPSFLIMMLISIFIPSQETSYKMVAATAAQAVYESPQAKDVGDKLLSLVNNKLEEFIKKDSKDDNKTTNKQKGE